MVDPCAEEAAKEVMELLPAPLRTFALGASIAEIIQRAIDDEYDHRLQDLEGS